jgi:hypothetical protein
MIGKKVAAGDWLVTIQADVPSTQPTHKTGADATKSPAGAAPSGNEDDQHGARPADLRQEN